MIDGKWIMTDANGDYTFTVADGIWNISVDLGGAGHKLPVSPTTYSFLFRADKQFQELILVYKQIR